MYIPNYTEALKAGGTTAMFDGLMNALKEIVTNGKEFHNLAAI